MLGDQVQSLGHAIGAGVLICVLGIVCYRLRAAADFPVVPARGIVAKLFHTPFGHVMFDSEDLLDMGLRKVDA